MTFFTVVTLVIMLEAAQRSVWTLICSPSVRQTLNVTHEVQILDSAPALLLDAPSLPSVCWGLESIIITASGGLCCVVSVLPRDRAARSSDGAALACFKGWWCSCVFVYVPVTEISCPVSVSVLTLELSLQDRWI